MWSEAANAATPGRCGKALVTSSSKCLSNGDLLGFVLARSMTPRGGIR